MTLRGFLFTLFFTGLLFSLSAHEATAGAKMMPHRAYYSAAIGDVKQTSRVVDVQGAIVMEAVESCEGWQTTEGTRLLLSNSQGGESVVDVRFLGWESKNGLVFRFNYTHHNDGSVQENMLGEAKIRSKGAAGEATFSRPPVVPLALPEKIVFPTEYILKLIERADAGEFLFSQVVFDGTKMGGAYEINAVIGRPYAFPAGRKAGLERLAGERGWPVRLAYFPIGSSEPEPEFEIGVRLLRSGIAESMVFDYGDFTITSRLERVEWLAAPKC
ncbi:MAG: DUF1849 family protein [Pseudomonadota bacterium]